MSERVTVLGEPPAAHEPGFVELFRPHAGKLGQGLVWLALTNGLLLAVPRLVNEGIAIVEGTAHTSDSMLSLFGIPSPSILTIVIALVVAAVVGGVVRVMSRVVLFNIGRDVERSLREMLFAHLSTLSPVYFRKSSIGDLMSRLTNDMTNVRLMAGFALLNALNAAIVFAATLPLLFLLDVKVAGFALLPFPLVLVAAQSVSKVMFRRTKENQEALGRLTSRVQENLAGQQVVRAFAREDAELAAFKRVNDDVFKASLRLATVRIFMGPLMGLMGTLGIGIALWTGGHAISEGRLDVGDVVEINTRLIMLAWPTIALGFILSVYQRGKASLVRIHEVLRERPDVVDGPVDQRVVGRVVARKLTIEVAPGKPGLIDLDVVVDKAKVLGIVGKTGSGKSTLLRALARQLPCPRDRLFLDDVDVNDWHLRALHAGVGVVPEDGFLFSLTLRENLAFGRPDASDGEINAVVDLCDLRRDVNAFPDGLQTLVGERGLTLSGGQRQRVALARAILSRPSVLLLDDSLSAVDAETEAKIVTGLRTGFGQAEPATLIVVSHRLSAVKEADEIIALDAGRVVERGTHDELLKNGGLYADLWGIEQLKKALAAGSEPSKATSEGKA